MTDTPPRNEHNMSEYGVLITGRNDWEGSPIHVFLSQLFPDHRSHRGHFHVNRLAKDLGMSHEAAYQWLRKGRLTVHNVKDIIELAKTCGSRVPDISEFTPFLFG